MDTPEGNSRRSWSGPRRGSGPRGTAGGTRATVLGSLASGRSVAADRCARRPAGRRADRPPAQPSGSRPADPALGRGDTAHPGL